MKSKKALCRGGLVLAFALAGCGGTAAASNHSKPAPSCIVTYGMGNDAFGNPMAEQYNFKSGILYTEVNGQAANGSSDSITAVPFSELSAKGQATVKRIQAKLPVQCQ